MPRQQSLNDSVARLTRVQRAIGRSPNGHAPQGDHTDFLALTLIVEKEERLIFYDWPAQRSPELIVVELCRRLVRGVEIVPRIQGIVAEELNRGSVQHIGAALGDNIDGGARTAAILRFEVRDHAQLGYSIHG